MPKILGHEKIIKDLTALADRGDLAHGYIFSGSSMLGKRAVAVALARYIEKGVFESAGMGEVLQDATIVDLEFAKQLNPESKDSVSIDAVREIKKFLWQKPIASPKRTLILDEAEFLTTEAQNALLKVTEEPPASSLIIIVTSDVDALIPTITSRLHRIHFGPVPEAKIAKWLTAGHAIPAEKAATLAKQSQGKPGLTLRLETDEALQKNIAAAEAFLKAPAASRGAVIKKLLEPEDFNLRIFLDALVIVLAWAMQKPTPGTISLWHKALTLYGRAMDFGLNPRLQLAALLAAD